MKRTNINYDLLNEYWVELYNRTTEVVSKTTSWCYGDVYKWIHEIRTNMKKTLCFVGCTNETRALVKVINKGTGETIYEAKVPEGQSYNEYMKKLDLPDEEGNKNA